MVTQSSKMGIPGLMSLVQSATRTADDAKWKSVRSRMRNSDNSNQEVQIEGREQIEGLILRPKRDLASIFKEGKENGR